MKIQYQFKYRKMFKNIYMYLPVQAQSNPKLSYFSSDITVNRSISDSSDITIIKSVSDSSDITVNRSVSDSSDITVNRSISDSSDITANRSISDSSDITTVFVSISQSVILMI